MRSVPSFLFVAAVAILAAAAVCPDSRGSGLLAPTDVSLPPLRITDHMVDVVVQDQIAITTLNQTFHNETNRRLEATYVFPLPENADLTDFQMTFNGQMVQGEVLPAKQAAQIYESIVRQSRDPGLIEFIGRRLLQMRVFPIEPGSDTRIQVKYQQICKPLNGMSAYHYPLRTRKTAGQAYGTVRFAVKLTSTAPLKNVWSPTHSVEIVREGEHTAKIAYEASHASLEDDFLLLYDTDASDLGMSIIASKPVESQTGHFVLTLTPKQLWPEQEYQPQDVVFVIDTSGSMAGDKMDQARAALKFCIDKLDERDRFSVVRFSTGFDVFSESLVEATKEKRDAGRAWVDKFSALGGTNIGDALHGFLDLRPPRDEQARPFVVVFLTDGIGNQPAAETLKMVSTHASGAGARIFPFGVGHDVDSVFLDQLAAAQTGRTTYVQPGENLELVLGEFFGVISQPVLTNLKLSLPEIGVTERFPATLGDLYHGQQLIVAGRFDKPVAGPVKLSAVRNGKQVEFVWPNVSFTNVDNAYFVPGIWAGRKIAYLVDQMRLHGENQEMINEVLTLSQEFGIQSPYSSWLVAPEQVRGGIPVARRARVPAGGLGATGAGGSGGGGTGGSGHGLGATSARSAPGTVSGGADRQSDLLRTVEPDAFEPSGDTADIDDLYEVIGQWGDVEGAVGQTTGEAAVLLAKKNAELKEATSKDEGRLEQAKLLTRKIGDRWYNRIGPFLVDQRVDEKTHLTIVKFGTDAYFELVQARADLRSALAASRSAVVLTAGNATSGETWAIVVTDQSGIDQFSDEQREQNGLSNRK